MNDEARAKNTRELGYWFLGFMAVIVVIFLIAQACGSKGAGYDDGYSTGQTAHSINPGVSYDDICPGLFEQAQAMGTPTEGWLKGCKDGLGN